MQQLDVIKPRFEFRTFGYSLQEEHTRMQKLSDPVSEELKERKSEETYIISYRNDLHNIKIRDDKLDIKKLIQSVENFEQWKPVIKVGFPISFDIMKNDIFPALLVELPSINSETFSISDLIQIVDTHPELQAVNVKKRRFGYLVNNAICEVAEVIINNKKVMTISVESTEINLIKKTIRDLGIDNFENINYLQAIKRIIGMIDLPLAN